MAEGVIEYISNDILLYGFLAQFLAAVLSIYFVPTIRKLALARDFTDSPSARKSHTKKVPVLGGVAIYLASVLSMFIIVYLFPTKIDSNFFMVLGLGSLMLLFAGVLDDLLGLKISQRFLIQTIVAILVIFKSTIFIFSSLALAVQMSVRKCVISVMSIVFDTVSIPAKLKSPYFLTSSLVVFV